MDLVEILSTMAERATEQNEVRALNHAVNRLDEMDGVMGVIGADAVKLETFIGLSIATAIGEKAKAKLARAEKVEGMLKKMCALYIQEHGEDSTQTQPQVICRWVKGEL